VVRVTVEVPLTRGLVAIVDDADGPTALAAGPWQALPSRNTYYARRAYRTAGGARAWQRLHTLLTGWPLVDHRNGDGLDCRRANLRPATVSQNGANATLRPDNRSGYKGVSRDQRRGLWTAELYADGRRHYLGRYADPADAARAYDAAARQHHGEFARLNFPEVTA
jgi:hypothetical protein